MHHNFLALLLISALSPTLAFAETATSAPCNLMDRSALAALQIVDSKMTVEHKKVEAGKNLPPQNIDICTFTSRNAPMPTITVTTVPLSKGEEAIKLNCTVQSLQGMELSVCNATVKGAAVSFSLVTKPSPGAAMPSTLRSQVERLIK